MQIYIFLLVCLAASMRMGYVVFLVWALFEQTLCKSCYSSTCSKKQSWANKRAWCHHCNINQKPHHSSVLSSHSYESFQETIIGLQLTPSTVFLGRSLLISCVWQFFCTVLSCKSIHSSQLLRYFDCKLVPWLCQGHHCSPVVCKWRSDHCCYRHINCLQCWNCWSLQMVCNNHFQRIFWPDPQIRSIYLSEVIITGMLHDLQG